MLEQPFEYLYRDAGNSKLWGELLLSNRSGMDIREAEQLVRSALIDGEFFIADLVEVPALKFENFDQDLDHGWHEFHSLTPSDEDEPAAYYQDIFELVNAFKKAAANYVR